MFRKAFIFLCIAGIVSQAGLISLYTITAIRKHKREVKAKMKDELKNGIHNAELVVFTELDLQNAEWEHAKEFFLGSDKFDVVKTEYGKNGILYFCINDKHEMTLMKRLDTHQKSGSIFEDLYKKFVLNFPSEITESNIHSSFGLSYTAQSENLYSFQYMSKCLHPPDVLFAV